jgi:hypothetical protein
MKEHPILFSGEMVRAILSGQKTQTRRPVKLDLDNCYDTVTPTGIARHPYCQQTIIRDFKCPHGQPGDRLWVRETIRKMPGRGNAPVYRADIPDDVAKDFIWTPSIHMPRGASRITLEVVSVRVERLQDITEADAQAEGVERINLTDGILHGVPLHPVFGVPKVHPYTSTYKDAFQAAWDTIYGSSLKTPRLWSSENSWVWVIEFKKV